MSPLNNEYTLNESYKNKNEHYKQKKIVYLLIQKKMGEKLF